MHRNRRHDNGDGMPQHRFGSAGVLLFAFFMATSQAQADTKPNVRAITAFVHLDPATLDLQISDALAVLRTVQQDFTRRGYESETIRIVMQPLGELGSGQSDEDALWLLRAIDDLSAKAGFIPSVGPRATARSLADDSHSTRRCTRFRRAPQWRSHGSAGGCNLRPRRRAAVADRLKL